MTDCDDIFFCCQILVTGGALQIVNKSEELAERVGLLCTEKNASQKQKFEI